MIRRAASAPAAKRYDGADASRRAIGAADSHPLSVRRFAPVPHSGTAATDGRPREHDERVRPPLIRSAVMRPVESTVINGQLHCLIWRETADLCRRLITTMSDTTHEMSQMPFSVGQRQAFVLMPFNKPYDSYYAPIFRAALEGVGFEVQRADDLFGPRPIMLDIQQAILRSDIVLCEMSGRNPNVFYELGLAHAIGKPAVLVANSKEDVPFDLRHVRTIIYDSTEPGWEDRLRTNIAMAAQAAVTSSHPWPPPLTQAFSADPMTISIDVPDMEHPLLVEAMPGDHIDVVLDKIYYKLRNRIPGYSYLEKWLLEDKGSGTRLILREIQHYVPASVVFGDDHEWKLVYLTEPYSATSSSERGKTR